MVYKKVLITLFLSLLLVNLNCKKGHKKEKIDSIERIVAIPPSSTEILFSIGAEDKIAGISLQCDYPPETRDIEKVGSYAFPDMEKILSLNPDLVILSPGIHDDLAESLRKMGIRVYVSSVRSIEDIFHEIEFLGKITGKEEEADALVRKLKKEMEEVRVEGKCRVFVEINENPLMTSGGISYINEMLSIAGGVNIFGDIPSSFPVVDQEEVIRRNPEVILVLHPSSKEEIKKRLGWSEIEAVKRDRIYIMPSFDELMRPGPRFITGIKKLSSILHR